MNSKPLSKCLQDKKKKATDEHYPFIDPQFFNKPKCSHYWGELKRCFLDEEDERAASVFIVSRKTIEQRAHSLHYIRERCEYLSNLEEVDWEDVWDTFALFIKEVDEFCALIPRP